MRWDAGATALESEMDMGIKGQANGVPEAPAMSAPIYLFMSTLAVFITYFGFITVATLLEAPSLAPWFELWTPLVDLLRQYVPSFDDAERALANRQMASRIAVVHHLMAAGWLLLVVALLLFIAVILSMPRAFWMRAHSSRTPRQCVMLAMLGIVAFPLCMAGAVLRMGRAIENPLYGDNVALFGSTLSPFLLAYMSACAVLLSLGALVVPRVAVKGDDQKGVSQ